MATTQVKPDVGLKEVEKFVKSDRVHMVAGFQWSNVMLAVRQALLENKIIMMSNVAGASQFAGKECTPYFISTSWNNDQTAQASGTLLNQDGIKTAHAMAPNYQAGKDGIAGFRSEYKGNVVNQTLFMLGESDFQADVSRIRAEKPEAVFFFGPGAMGISFLKQWAASGAAKGDQALHAVYGRLDHLAGDRGIGARHGSYESMGHRREERAESALHQGLRRQIQPHAVAFFATGL